MSAEVVELIIGIIALVYVSYKIGYDAGRIEERSAVIGIIRGIKLNDISSEMKYKILYVLNAISTSVAERK